MYSLISQPCEGQKRHISYFDNLKADSRNITNSMTFATKSSNQNFIVFLNKVQATVVGYKGCDFLAIIDQLDPDTLPNGRIWLFGFNSYFFQHNSFCMRSTSERVGLQGCAQMSFLILFIMPLLVSSVTTELPSSRKSTTLAHPVRAAGLSKKKSRNFFLRRLSTNGIPGLERILLSKEGIRFVIKSSSSWTH
uniref:Uncharacterized protein n=1 Tax=Pongo abelii TaxID=9601 RepID=A0A8I5YT79_PONAB